MKKLLFILLCLPMIGLGQNKDDEFQLIDRPKDFEYLSAPDSNGVRRQLKMPSTTKAVLKLPYPIIFIHGLSSESDAVWNPTVNWMQSQYNLSFGGRFDFCLNYDDDNSNANLIWATNTSPGDLALFTGTHVAADIYYINFDVGIDGTYDPVLLNPVNVKSNQAAIVKQGKAVSRAIQKVLLLTGRDKVILMGHSMGGLAAREYLQNSSIWQADGLSHVAKLITTGTPHGGSNASTSGWVVSGVDCSSEAYRDLRTTYSGTNAPGVYLFGGSESSSIMSLSWCTSFDNLDVNCSGAVSATITGLNNKDINHSSIDYACIIGKCSGCPSGEGMPGDGVVSEYKANINNYCPNCPSTGVTNNIFYYNASATIEIHRDLPKQSYQNMQGLDEPNELHYAYNIDFNTLYTGVTTMQPVGGYSYDYDDYKFDLPVSGDVYVSISGINHPNLGVVIYDGNSTQASYNVIGTYHVSNGSSIINFTQALSAGSYYLEIYATPTTTTNLGSYKFYLNSSTSTTNLGEYTISTKKILKLVDVLGRETKGTKNELLFYIYDDGTVEKRIIVE
jgi:pimeloyl-ACP methyl ester carboxylesterase